jgi:hypothetical protein
MLLSKKNRKNFLSLTAKRQIPRVQGPVRQKRELPSSHAFDLARKNEKADTLEL